MQHTCPTCVHAHKCCGVCVLCVRARALQVGAEIRKRFARFLRTYVEEGGAHPLYLQRISEMMAGACVGACGCGG